MKRRLVLILLMALILPLVIVSSRAEIFHKKKAAPETTAANAANALRINRSQQAQPVSKQAVGFAESIPLRDMPDAKYDSNGSSQFGQGGREINEANEIEVRRPQVAGAKTPIDPLVRRNQKNNGPQSPLVMPTPTATFEGLSSNDNLTAYAGSTVMPPDTNGAVGPTQYVETSNILFQVYDKTGNPLLAGGRKYSQLFSTINDPCSSKNDGDPIVLYDQLADRWMISQFCVSVANPNNHQVIAISKTGDATGAYFLYDFMMPNNKFNDYPHFGIWPDAYYMTDHQFNQAGNTFLGAGAFAFDRNKMIAGDPTASFIYFDYANIDGGVFGQLPASVDGLTPPPVGTPNLVCHYLGTIFGDPVDGLECYEFKPNFATPASSTFTLIPDIPWAAFDPRDPGGRADVEQPSPALATENLDSIGNRLMFRIAYRNLGTAATPVNSYTVNMTVNVSGTTPSNGATYQAGIRWAELRRDPSTGAMSVRDQGTHSSATISGASGENNWLGSIAQDNQGNIALGFSSSGTGTGCVGGATPCFPSIKWAGRGTAVAGALDQGEAVMFAGTGVQDTTNSRWGDYSGMSVDPADDCTFWFASEYRLAANNGAGGDGVNPFRWNTRVGNFKYSTCTASPRGAITGTVTSAATGLPIANAVIKTSDGYIRVTDASGNYSMNPMTPNSYSVTASARGGYAPQTAPSVAVTNGGSTIQNFVLGAASDVALGTVTITEGNLNNGNGAVEPGETANIVVQLTNPSTSAPATNVQASLRLKDQLPGVTLAGTSFNYGTIPGSGNVSNAGTPYKLILGNQVPCGTVINLLLDVSFGGGTSPVSFAIQTTINCQCSTVTEPLISETLDASAPPNGATYTASTGNQNVRLGRTGAGTNAVCGIQKANPGIIAGGTGTRRYDAYLYTNNTAITQCETVTVTQDANLFLMTVAYNTNGFIPSSITTNYLADAGPSTTSMTYGFNVPARQRFTVVVNEANSNAVPIAYTMSLARQVCAQPPVHRASNFDSDNKTDITVYRPSTGQWVTFSSATGFYSSRVWGAATDKPVPGDYDGDGITDLAVFRPSEGNWYIINSSTNTGFVQGWGNSTDKPAPGDYDGDGRTDIAVFRPSEGNWYIRNSSTGTNSVQNWGTSTDKPIPGDYDGDLKTDIAVFRPSEGNWYVKKSSGGTSVQSWGTSTDVLVPGDYDGDGKTDLAVFRPSEGNWYIINSGTGAVTLKNWGASTDIPVPGDYDGDGKTDIAVYRPSEGNWYVVKSSNNSTTVMLNGIAGDTPVPSLYVPQ